MSRQLIALDLDGTTLDPTGKLSPTTVATLKKATACGHLVVLATGRPDTMATDFYDQLKLDSPMVNFNGALVYRPHQAWAGERQKVMPKATALALRALKADFPIRLMVAEGKRLRVPDHGYRDVPFMPDLPNPPALLDEAGLRRDPISMTMFVEEKAVTPLQAAIAAKFPQLTAKTWGAWSGTNTALEVTAGHSGKAEALAHVAGQYGIAQADVIAIGDDLNDLDMLTFAGVGVAMANARPEVLAAADKVTRRDNARDGVADFLQAHLAL